MFGNGPFDNLPDDPYDKFRKVRTDIDRVNAEFNGMWKHALTSGEFVNKMIVLETRGKMRNAYRIMGYEVIPAVEMKTSPEYGSEWILYKETLVELIYVTHDNPIRHKITISSHNIGEYVSLFYNLAMWNRTHV